MITTHTFLKRSGRRTRVYAAALAVSLLTMTSGCSVTVGLPTSGSVQQLPTQQQEQKRVYTAPQDPVKGATPESIIKGFLSALPAGPQSDGFLVAKKFLTPSAAASWDTDSRTLVYVSDPQMSRQAVKNVLPGGESSVEGLQISVAFKVSGQIDGHGLYSAEDSTKTTALNYGLTKIKGEWRISTVPSGIAVMDSDFEQAFRQVTLYQTDVARRTLIPDVRWFGWRQWRTLAVKELLRGPADWLGAAAIRLTTNEVSLDMDSVPNVEGKVQVRLSAAVMDMAESSRALLIRQIRLTLGDGNTGYDLSVKSSAGDDLSSLDSRVTASVDMQNTRIYSLSRGALVLVQSPNLLRLAETDQAGDANGLAFTEHGGGAIRHSDFTVSCVKEQGSGCGQMFEGQKVRALAEGIGGEVWATTFQAEPRLMVQKGDALTQLPLAWLDEGQMTAVAVSSEGSRVIVALRGQSGVSLLMAGIQRDVDGNVTAVSDSAQVIAHVPDIAALSFYDDTTVVYALASSPRGLRQLAPGPETEQSLPSGTISLASGLIDGTQGLVALDTSGIVRSVTGSLTTSWTLTDSQVSAISSGK